MGAIIKTFPTRLAWESKRPPSLNCLDHYFQAFWTKTKPSVPNDKIYIDKKLKECIAIQNSVQDIESKNHLESIIRRCRRYLHQPSQYPALYERLDIVIQLYESCINILRSRKLNDKPLSDKEYEVLSELKGRCQTFIGALADNLNINAREINEIKEKRKIDPTYLPNHLPAHLSEPIYYKPNTPLEKHFPRKDYLKYVAQYRNQVIKNKYKEKLKFFEKTIYNYKKCCEVLDDLDNNLNDSEKNILEKKRKFFEYYLSIFFGKKITPQTIESITQERKKHFDYLWRVLLNYLVKHHKIPLKVDLTDPYDFLKFVFKRQRLKEIFSHGNLLQVSKEYVRKEVLPKALFATTDPNKCLENSSEALRNVYLLLHESYDIRTTLLHKYLPEKDPAKEVVPWDEKLIASFTQEEKKAISIIKFFEKSFPQERDYLDPQYNQNILFKYLSESEREPYRIFILNGKLYHYKYKKHTDEMVVEPFDSSKNFSHSKKGWVSIVMNIKGEMFADSHFRGGIHLHSSFTKGSLLYFAGEVKIVDGRIVEISDYSGHYTPRDTHLVNFIKNLVNKKVNLENVIIHRQNRQLLRIKEKKIKEKVKLATENQQREILEKFYTDVEKFKYSDHFRFKGKMISFKPMSKGRAAAYVAFFSVLVLSVTALVVGSVLSLGVVPVVLGSVGIVFSVATVVGIKFEWQKKLFSFLKKVLPNQKAKEKKPDNPIVILPQTSTTQKLSQSILTNSSSQTEVLDTDSSDEDKEFTAKWANTSSGKKSDYPEWVRFVQYIKEYVKENPPNYGKVNEQLSIELKQLLQTFYNTEDHCYKKNGKGQSFYLPEAVYVWKREENLKKLFLEVARDFKNDIEELGNIELKVFRPVLVTVVNFVKTFDNYYSSADKIFSEYEELRRKELSEYFKVEDCKPTTTLPVQTTNTDQTIALH